jgi:uncharacterized membrane protein YfcA
MFPVSPLEVVAVSVIVALGACVQGSIGFGWAMVAAPFVVLIEPDFVPAPMILSGLILTLLMTYRERKSIDTGGVRWMSAGSVPGIVAASAILTVISSTGFTILFSILVLLAVALSAIGFSVALTNRNVFIAGLLAGFMGTTSSIGGPPVALIYQNVPGPQLRGTLSAFFFICGALALVGLVVAGWLGSDELTLAVLLIPGLIIGYTSSRFTAGIMDRHSIRPAALTLSGLAAVAVLLRAVL